MNDEWHGLHPCQVLEGGNLTEQWFSTLKVIKSHTQRPCSTFSYAGPHSQRFAGGGLLFSCSVMSNSL